MNLLLLNLVTDSEDPVLGFTTRWIRALAARIESIDVVTMRAGRIDVPSHVRVHSVGKERGYGEPRRVYEFYRHLRRILGERRIDVCFSHMAPIFSVLAAPLLKPRRIPIITWYAHREVSPTLRLAHHLSDRVVSCHPSSYPFRDHKVAYLGHGIDLELFSPTPAPPERPPIVLSVGRLSPIKGLETLVAAIDALREQAVEVRCVLVGEPPTGQEGYGRELRERVSRLKLDSHCEFAGRASYEQTPAWYARSTVHVNLAPLGALDKAALEAMACGRPSVVANPAFVETLGPYADLLLFRHGDAADLAGRLATLLSKTAAERAAMGVALAERVSEMHGLERLASKLVQELERTVSSTRGEGWDLLEQHQVLHGALPADSPVEAVENQCQEIDRHPHGPPLQVGSDGH